MPNQVYTSFLNTSSPEAAMLIYAWNMSNLLSYTLITVTQRLNTSHFCLGSRPSYLTNLLSLRYVEAVGARSSY